MLCVDDRLKDRVLVDPSWCSSCLDVDSWIFSVLPNWHYSKSYRNEQSWHLFVLFSAFLGNCIPYSAINSLLTLFHCRWHFHKRLQALSNIYIPTLIRIHMHPTYAHVHPYFNIHTYMHIIYIQMCIPIEIPTYIHIHTYVYTHPIYTYTCGSPIYIPTLIHTHIYIYDIYI